MRFICYVLGACTRAMPSFKAVPKSAQSAHDMAAKGAAMVAASRAMDSRCTLVLLHAGRLHKSNALP